MPNIKINNLTVKLHNKKEIVTAIDNLSLDIESETFNVFVGYSGSGKTTLLRTIGGLEEYQGEILVDNINIEEYDQRSLNISMIFQSIALFPHMTIFDNIAYSLKLRGIEKEEIERRVLEIADILDIRFLLSRKPKHISIGQQQKVQLAKAMVKHPSIVLMDEPLSNVDYKNRIALRVLIKKIICQYGATCLYVTHDLSEAMSLADNLFVLNNGIIEVSGKPLDVYNSDNELIKTLRSEYQESENPIQ